MRLLKKLLVVFVAVMMVMSLTSRVYAADETYTITITTTSTTDEAQKDTTVYTYYKILDAIIEDASKITVDPKTGESNAGTGDNAPKVSYYVDTEAKANALKGLKVGEGENAKDLFVVTKDATQNKWYVALPDGSTVDAQTIADKLSTVKSTFATTDNTFAQTTPGGTASKSGLVPGYYLIESTAGTKLAVQTLADITINEKNTFPPVEKEVDETDKNAQIGDEISYTLTVKVPGTANDTIVLTDTMTAGLTFKRIDSVLSGADSVSYTLNPESPSAADKTFTITFDAATVKNNQGKTITITYTAILNKDAKVETPEKNTVTLKYGNNYESKPKETETKTYDFKFDKVDGSDKQKKLPGAEFELRIGDKALDLVEVESGKTYRIATSEDQTKTTKIVTNGNTVTIIGLDSDITYSLVETKAPTGYNKMEDPTEVKATETTQGEDDSAVTTIAFADGVVENNKGGVLPSTGGIGTTIFHIAGAALVLGAGILLISKKRMNNN